MISNLLTHPAHSGKRFHTHLGAASLVTKASVWHHLTSYSGRSFSVMSFSVLPLLYPAFFLLLLQINTAGFLLWKLHHAWGWGSTCEHAFGPALKSWKGRRKTLLRYMLRGRSVDYLDSLSGSKLDPGLSACLCVAWHLVSILWDQQRPDRCTGQQAVCPLSAPHLGKRGKVQKIS